MQRFTKINAWKRAHGLALRVHRLAPTLPAPARSALATLLLRAALAVPARIAEGSKRQDPRDYARLLNLAESSLAETEALVLVAQDLAYLSEATALELLADISETARLLHGLRTAVARGGSGLPAGPLDRTVARAPSFEALLDPSTQDPGRTP